jgi:Antitoxin Phd_YefM, type II toxin-antitoxin system
MKVIDLQEAKANLEQYAAECQTSPIVVTQEGQPIFELLPIRPDDSGFLDHLIERDPTFRGLVEQAREKSEVVVCPQSNRSATDCSDWRIDRKTHHKKRFARWLAPAEGHVGSKRDAGHAVRR